MVTAEELKLPLAPVAKCLGEPVIASRAMSTTPAAPHKLETDGFLNVVGPATACA